MSGLAPFVRILGRGPGRSRNMTEAEAEAALRIVLEGEAAPEAVGALLMLMRFRGENAEEVAGFVRALRAEVPAWRGLPAALDWPSYASGRSRGLPWFLLSAKLAAAAGCPVLIHGWNGAGAERFEAALGRAGIALVRDPGAARRALEEDGVAYAPLADLAPRALRLLKLRAVLGLRSPVNTALRLLNPAGAQGAAQGVFHPTYRELGRDAAFLLGQPHLAVIKGGGGEFERHPGKAVVIAGIRNGSAYAETAPALVDETRRLADPEGRDEDLSALWRGDRADAFAEATVIGTAALALTAAGVAGCAGEAVAQARALWRDRAA